jgi:RNA polymerase sigma factor (sigma-70 family)
MAIHASSSEPGTEAVDPAIDWVATLNEHRRWLRTALFARLRRADAVDEVMQEVSLAAVSLGKPLDEPHRVGAWLYRVALRQSLLYRRRNGRRDRLIGNYAQRSAMMPTEQIDPLNWLLREERHRLLREALAAMESADREILLLKYTEEWSCRELAARLGVSESCVEARLHRARQRLRQAMTGGERE